MKWELNKNTEVFGQFKQVWKFAWRPVKASKEGVDYMVWLEKYYTTYQYNHDGWKETGNWVP